jgi:hypothetical protein
LQLHLDLVNLELVEQALLAERGFSGEFPCCGFLLLQQVSLATQLGGTLSTLEGLFYAKISSFTRL